MGKLILVASLGAIGCGSLPAIELGFQPFDSPENPPLSCQSSEATWLAELARVWVSVEGTDGPIGHACVEAAGLTTWDALESKLRRAGDLVEELPIGPSFDIYLVGVKLEACPGEGGPTTPFDFCAYTTHPVSLHEDEDVRAELQRYCQNHIDWSDCLSFADGRQVR